MSSSNKTIGQTVEYELTKRSLIRIRLWNTLIFPDNDQRLDEFGEINEKKKTVEPSRLLKTSFDNQSLVEQ